MSVPNTVCERCGKSYYTSPCKLSISRYCSKACQYDFESLFWSHVDKSGDCWIWLSIRNERGYGIFTRKKYGKTKRLLAHRVAYDLTHDVHLGEMLGCHKCDNPACVNPDHIFPGTDLDNTLDMMAKGRHVSVVKPESQVRGSDVWLAKLTDDQVLAIRQEYASSVISTRVLGQKYNVSKHTIETIVRGETWTHIPVIESSITTNDRLRATIHRGENHPNAILSDDDMRAINAAYRTGKYSQNQLTAMWSVKRGVVRNAIRKF